jgi:hypothetical protein
MTKRIWTFLIPLLAIPLLLTILFIRSYTSYELENGDKINNEIPRVDCFFGRDGDELFVNIVECDWYGRDICVNGQKVVEGTLQVTPYLGKAGDTLKFIRQVEGSLIYRCPTNNACWTDKLKLSLTYKFDSLDNSYHRRLLLTLNKKRRFGFSVH